MSKIEKIISKRYLEVFFQKSNLKHIKKIIQEKKWQKKKKKRRK